LDTRHFVNLYQGIAAPLIIVKTLEAWRSRQKDRLTYLEVQFDAAQAHTEGLLVPPDESLPREFQAMHNRFLGLLRDSGPGRLVLYAAVIAASRDNFEQTLKGLKRAWETDENQQQELKWLDQRSHPKITIQKGQVAPQDERPQIILRSRRIYRNTDELYLIEGMSVIQQWEHEVELARSCGSFECNLRVLKTMGGGDHEYLGLLRLPKGWQHRFGKDDTFDVSIFPGEPDWSATALQRSFNYFTTYDVNVVLHRPLTTAGYDRNKLASVFDLGELGQEESKQTTIDVLDFCYTGASITVKVTPRPSDMFKLAAIKAMNPAHEGEKNHVLVNEWNRILLGQNLLVTKSVDVFRGCDIYSKLKEWGIKMDPRLEKCLEYFRILPNMFGIVLGPWGTGKTYLDGLIAMLLIHFGFTVKVCSSTNRSADAFILALHEQIRTVEARGHKVTHKRIVRVHAFPTEHAAVVREDNLDPSAREQNILRQRWASHPTPTGYYDRICHKLIDQSKYRPFKGVYDRRYLLDEYSLGTLVLEVTGLEDRSASSTTEGSDVAKASGSSKKTRRSAPTGSSLPPPASGPSSTPTPAPASIAAIYDAQQTGVESRLGDMVERVIRANSDGKSDVAKGKGREQDGDRHEAVGSTTGNPEGLAEDVEAGVWDSRDFSNPNNEHAADTEEADDDTDGESYTDFEDPERSRKRSATSKKQDPAASEKRKRAFEELQRKSALYRDMLPGGSELGVLKRKFRELFCSLEREGSLSDEDRRTFRIVEQQLIQKLFETEICLVPCTLVNSGTSQMEDFVADHTIIAEAGRAENGDAFIAFSRAGGPNQTLHMSGDHNQLRPREKDPQVDCFANCTNVSVLERDIRLGYPSIALELQRRTIPLISDLISKYSTTAL